jgi:hypothetical protein
MKGRKRFTIASTLFVALTVSAAEASARSGQPAAGDQARETPNEIQRSASKAADEADSLRRIADRFSVESQYDELMALRDNINRMVRDVSGLEAESGLAPWEKQAADKVDALLFDTAKDTQDAINYFNENKADLWDGHYRGYVGGVYQGSDRIAATLKDYLKYAKARDQQEQLQERLKVTGE